MCNTNIWFNHKKGIRAGNSPVWKPKKGLTAEEIRAEEMSKGDTLKLNLPEGLTAEDTEMKLKILKKYHKEAFK